MQSLAYQGPQKKFKVVVTIIYKYLYPQLPWIYFVSLIAYSFHSQFRNQTMQGSYLTRKRSTPIPFFLFEVTKHTVSLPFCLIYVTRLIIFSFPLNCDLDRNWVIVFNDYNSLLRLLYSFTKTTRYDLNIFWERSFSYENELGNNQRKNKHYTIQVDNNQRAKDDSVNPDNYLQLQIVPGRS